MASLSAFLNHPSFLLRQDLLLNPELTNWLNWLALSFRDLPCLVHPSLTLTRVTAIFDHTRHFM